MSDATATLLLVAFMALAGLAVGSFLNVVIYRVPRGLSVVRPRSFCPACERELTPLENVPVFSYLALRGKCRSCSAAISPRYPAIETATAALFVALSVEFRHDPRLPAVVIFASGALALAVIDAETLRLPTPLVRWHFALTALSLGVAALATGSLHRTVVALAATAFWAGSFTLIATIAPGKLGGGDVRFAYVLGLISGSFGAGTALLAYFASSALGLIVSLILIASGAMKRNQPLPFGCYLAAGTTLAVALSPLISSQFQL